MASLIILSLFSLKFLTGCADISVPVQSRFQTFALQIFFCSAYGYYLNSLGSDVFSHNAHFCRGVSFVNMLNLLITLEAPILSLQQVVHLMAHNAIIDSLSEWEQLSLVAGSVCYCNAILNTCVQGESSAVISSASMRNITALCRDTHSAIGKITARCNAADLVLGTVALQVVEALQLISQQFETLQLWAHEPREHHMDDGGTMSHFVQESIRQLAYFFLSTLNNIVSMTKGRTNGQQREMPMELEDMDVAALLPPGLLGVLLRCCIDPHAQHLVTCCCTALFLRGTGTGRGREGSGEDAREDTRGGTGGMSRAALVYVDWCLERVSSSRTSSTATSQHVLLQPVTMPTLLQELQAFTLNVIQQGSSAGKSGIITTTDDALQLNKVNMHALLCFMSCLSLIYLLILTG